MMRHILTLDLKNDLKKIAEYENLHSPEKIWKEIPQGIKEIGVTEMEIYRWENRLFMIMETPDNFDWDTQMSKLSNLPRQKEWEILMNTYQKTHHRNNNEKWQKMKRIFKLTNCY